MSLYVLSLSSVVLGECAAPSGNVRKTIHMQSKKCNKKFWQQCLVSVKTVSLQLCEISYVGCRWSWMPMVYMLIMFLRDC
jgi:hypothetical protein